MLRRMTRLVTPVQEFLHTEAASGVLLGIATILALIAANSGLAPLYESFLSLRVVAGAGAIVIDKPLLLWINDGLMAVFFLIVGLEIKREMKYGQLSDFRSALLPAVGAAGGAIVPALIFLAFTAGTPLQRGWAIPMATDIAFAVGLLALVGSRVPAWTKLFLLTLAVVDDLIAVVVIALFYTEALKIAALVTAGIAAVVLLLFNFAGVRRLWPYLLGGVVLWVAVLKSGVHATIAGVLLGLIIPAIVHRRSVSEELAAIEEETRGRNTGKGVARLETAPSEGIVAVPDEGEMRQQRLEEVEEMIIDVESPLHRLEHKLHPFVAWFVIPIFAFANAGVAIDPSVLRDAFASALGLGIILGLFIGKQTGIFLSVVILMKLRLTTLRFDSPTLAWLYGTSLLAGIGFTMSLFIGSLAFGAGPVFEQAKVAILAGSLVSGALGFAVLKFVHGRSRPAK